MDTQHWLDTTRRIIEGSRCLCRRGAKCAPCMDAEPAPALEPQPVVLSRYSALVIDEAERMRDGRTAD